MRLRLLPAVLCCASFAASTFSGFDCFAQVTKPQPSPSQVKESEDDSVVLIAMGPLDTLIPNIQHVARNVGAGAVAGGIVTAANQFLNGLDRARPFGVFVGFDDSNNPVPIGCLPVKDLEVFFDQLGTFGEANDLGNGLYEFSLGRSIYAKKMGDWLFIAQSEDALENIQAGKANSLVKLIQKYDVRIQINPQNLPDDLVDFVISQMQAGVERGINANGDMDADEAAAAKATSEQAIAQIQEGIEGTEKFIVGLTINKQEKKTILDFGSQFIADSKYAKQMEKAKTSKSAFTGIPQENSTMTLQTFQVVEPEEIAQLEKTLESSLKAAFNAIDQKSKDPNSAAKAKDFISRGVDILIESAKQGKLESAVDVSVESGLSVVASMGVSDGSKVEALASELAKEIAKETKDVQVQIGTGKHGGFNLHKVIGKLPPQADDSVRKIFGDSVTVAIGTSPKAVLIALGKNCDASLKSAIDRVASKPTGQAEMVKMRFGLTQLLNYIQSIEPTPVSEAMLSAATSGNDRVMIDSQSVERGAVVRLTLEDGVLKAIAAGVKVGQGAGGGF